jgi:invasion protein IalB
MLKWTASALVRPAACAFALAMVASFALIAPGTNSFAEEKKAAPKAKPAPKAEPQPQPQAQPEPPPLIFSPWTKFCQKQPAEPKPIQVCFTVKEGRVETGQPVVGAVLIEPDHEPRKILRVTLPLGMSLLQGTRVIIDQGQPMTAPYVICFNNGCLADYEASQQLIDIMKKGKGLAVQGINGAGQPLTLVLPLDDFAKAYDGPAIDPKEHERKQQELQDQLNRRAEEARKKLESGQK